MYVQANNWQLFPSPPSSSDGDAPGARVREMMADASDRHRDHFDRRIQALPAARDVEAAVPVPLPVVNADPPRTWPRTIAVSLVLLTFAGAGTLVSTIINALINKSIMDNGGKS